MPTDTVLSVPEKQLPIELRSSGDYRFFRDEVKAFPLGYYSIPRYDTYMAAWYRPWTGYLCEKYYALLYNVSLKKYGSVMRSFDSLEDFFAHCNAILVRTEQHYEDIKIRSSA
jgi:hypothetical protein